MKPLGVLGTPLSLFYEMGIRAYRWSYESGLRSRHNFSRPVLSVGNIEAGGTGKTPLVLALCRRILERGRMPAVVSRGYGRRHPEKNLFVSRGEGRILPPEEAGDEPALLARTFREIPVVVARNRSEGIRMIEESCDIAILDDGFQSLEVLPAAALVFLPALLLQRHPRRSDLLPAGPLREPADVLDRATHWVLALGEGGTERGQLSDQSIYSRLSGILPESSFRPILRVRFAVFSVREDNGREHPAASLGGVPVSLVVGIANTDRVIDQVRALGAIVTGSLILPDHASYNEENRIRIETFASKMKRQGARMLLTTEKDRIKWPDSPSLDLPIGVLVGRSDLLDPERWDGLLSVLLPD